MFAVLLALGSSLAYGYADFLGGLGARKADVLRTVTIAAPASLAVELLLWPFFGASFAPATLAWGAASGVASATAFALLYKTLAVGPMNVLSPVTALVSAMLPVGVGLVQGEHLGPVGLLGLPLALAAVVLVSAGRGGKSARPSRTALLLAVGAGAAIALQLVFLHQAPSDSGVGPLIIGRAVSSAVILAAAAVMFRRLGRERPAYGISAAAGVLDSFANVLFLLAARSGDLAVVAVLTALYPAGTVLLARSVLSERIHHGQLVGLGTAAVAVNLLALTCPPVRQEPGMFIQPWDAALDDAEWQTWIAEDTASAYSASTVRPDRHRPSCPPTSPSTARPCSCTSPAPTRYGRRSRPSERHLHRHRRLRLHTRTLARQARHRPTDGVPTSYYATVQFTCQATIIDDPAARPSCCSAR
nr:DMT family transporter [Streptomyces sp. SID9727]